MLKTPAFVLKLVFESTCLSQQNANTAFSCALASGLGLVTDTERLPSAKVLRTEKGVSTDTASLPQDESGFRQMQNYKWFLDHDAPALALYKSSVQWGAVETGVEVRVEPEKDGCQM